MQNDQSPTVADVSTLMSSENPADLAVSRQAEQMTSRKKLLCPSAPAKENSILLGVVQSDGSVAFIKDRIKITREFLDITVKAGRLETRFRFSSPCIKSGCVQWANNECSLPKLLAERIPREMISGVDVKDTPLPNCSIRDECRWFTQHGADACHICPMVITRRNS